MNRATLVKVIYEFACIHIHYSEIRGISSRIILRGHWALGGRKGGSGRETQKMFWPDPLRLRERSF